MSDNGIYHTKMVEAISNTNGAYTCFNVYLKACLKSMQGKEGDLNQKI